MFAWNRLLSRCQKLFVKKLLWITFQTLFYKTFQHYLKLRYDVSVYYIWCETPCIILLVGWAISDGKRVFFSLRNIRRLEYSMQSEQNGMSMVESKLETWIEIALWTPRAEVTNAWSMRELPCWYNDHGAFPARKIYIMPVYWVWD